MALITLPISPLMSNLINLQFSTRRYEVRVQPFQTLRLQEGYQSLAGFYDAAVSAAAIYKLGGVSGSTTPYQYISATGGWTTGEYSIVNANELPPPVTNATGQPHGTITFSTPVMQTFSGCETTSLEISSMAGSNSTLAKWSISARGDVSQCWHSWEVEWVVVISPATCPLSENSGLQRREHMLRSVGRGICQLLHGHFTSSLSPTAHLLDTHATA